MPCDMPMQLNEKGAMKEVLQALTKQMWDRMKAGKSESAMSGEDVSEALEEAGEEASPEEAVMEALEDPKPKGKVMELSTVKLGLLGPNRKGGMRRVSEMSERTPPKKKGKA